MTTARDNTRPDRRPEWLRRKHGHAQPKPRTTLDFWADKIMELLDGVQTGQHAGPWPDHAQADEARKALYRAGRRRPNSRVAAYVADPATGTCARCDEMHCQPSAKGQLMIHVGTFTDRQAYEYMLRKYGPDTSKWPYIPGKGSNPPPGQPGSASQPSAGKVPAACPHCHRCWRVPAGWERFTCPACNGTVERHAAADSANRFGSPRAGAARNQPDEPPARQRGGPATKPADRPKPEAKAAEPAKEPEREPFLDRIRRSLS